MAEAVDLEVDNHMAFQDAVVENEVGLEIVLVNEDPLLSGLEAEAATHLHEYHLEMVENGGFQLALSIDVLRRQPQEFKRHGVVDDFVRRQLLRIL